MGDKVSAEELKKMLDCIQKPKDCKKPGAK